jgi:hypothetical protein
MVEARAIKDKSSKLDPRVFCDCANPAPARWSWHIRGSLGFQDNGDNAGRELLKTHIGKAG